MTQPQAPRLCDVCWQLDTSPRHVVHVSREFPGAVPTDEQITALDQRSDIPASALREILDPTTVVRHHDCCAAQGCPTNLCGQLVEAVGGAQDTALRELIISGAVDHLRTPSGE